MSSTVIIIIAAPIIANMIDHASFHLEAKIYDEQDLTRQRMARSRNKGVGLIYWGLLFDVLDTASQGAFCRKCLPGVGLLSYSQGLAAQDSLSNIIAGITLVICRRSG